MNSRVCAALFLFVLVPLVGCKSQTTSTSPDCVPGQPPKQVIVTVYNNDGMPAVDKDKETVQLCKLAGDSVVWQGSPHGLKFGIVFESGDKPFQGAYFTEADNTSNEITASANAGHTFKYRIYFPKSGKVLDPGIIIK